MAAHGLVRAAVDLDIWVMPSEDNAKAVMRALQRFGAGAVEARRAQGK